MYRGRNYFFTVRYPPPATTTGVRTRTPLPGNDNGGIICICYGPLPGSVSGSVRIRKGGLGLSQSISRT